MKKIKVCLVGNLLFFKPKYFNLEEKKSFFFKVRNIINFRTVTINIFNFLKKFV